MDCTVVLFVLQYFAENTTCECLEGDLCKTQGPVIPTTSLRLLLFTL